jgi:hypothetical protein
MSAETSAPAAHLHANGQHANIHRASSGAKPSYSEVKQSGSVAGECNTQDQERGDKIGAEHHHAADMRSSSRASNASCSSLSSAPAVMREARLPSATFREPGGPRTFASMIPMSRDSAKSSRKGRLSADKDSDSGGNNVPRLDLNIVRSGNDEDEVAAAAADEFTGQNQETQTSDDHNKQYHAHARPESQNALLFDNMSKAVNQKSDDKNNVGTINTTQPSGHSRAIRPATASTHTYAHSSASRTSSHYDFMHTGGDAPSSVSRLLQINRTKGYTTERVMYREFERVATAGGNDSKLRIVSYYDHDIMPGMRMCFYVCVC